MQPLWNERYQPADAEIVRQKARKMMKRRTLREHQLEDIEQEMSLRVIQQSHLQRPEQGSREGFVGKTAENAYLSLYEKRTTQKREDKRNISIDAGPQRALIDGRTTQEQMDLALDLEKFVDRMPPEVRQVYELCLEGRSQTDLQGLLNLPRGQVRTLLQRMTKHLAEYVSASKSKD